MYHLWKRRRLPPVLVWTDASYEPDGDPPGCLGVVVCDTAGAGRWFHASLDISAEWVRRYAPKETYIGQLETLAAVAAYYSLPGVIGGRDVIHFVDNTGALCAVSKGYSSDVDSARLSHALQSFNAHLRANVWFNYVPSGANISDLPSRGRTGEYRRILQEMFNASSAEVELALPPEGSWWDVHRSAGETSRSRKRARRSRS